MKNNSGEQDIVIKNCTSRSNGSNITKIINRNYLHGTGKKINRCRSFHFRYMELCRAKNFPTLSDIKAKNNATSVLDFFGDKLRTDDWLLVLESLHFDQFLQTLAIRLRRNGGGCSEQIFFISHAIFYLQFWSTSTPKRRQKCLNSVQLYSQSTSSVE